MRPSRVWTEIVIKQLIFLHEVTFESFLSMKHWEVQHKSGCCAREAFTHHRLTSVDGRCPCIKSCFFYKFIHAFAVCHHYCCCCYLAVLTVVLLRAQITSIIFPDVKRANKTKKQIRQNTYIIFRSYAFCMTTALFIEMQ